MNITRDMSKWRTATPDADDIVATPERPVAMRAERLAVAFTALAVVVWACWRTQFGADTGDGSHSVAMAIRLACGAVPFVDEMNAQSTGSFLAVPFTWIWLHAVGLDGIILASRLYFVALSTFAGFIAYRALRPAFRPWVAFAVPAIALIPTAYDLMLVNYTTVPSMALIVAVAAGHAAIVRKSLRWAPVSGAAAAIAGFSHPAALPSAALLIVICLALVRDRRVRLMVFAGAAAVSLAVVLWLLIAVGVSNVRGTLTYTANYQAVRVPPLTRVRSMIQLFADNMISWRYVPLYVLGAAALLPRLSDRVRAMLLVAAVVAAAVPSLLLAETVILPPAPFGRLSGVYATVLTIALFIPEVVTSLRLRDHSARYLLALALPSAIISIPVTAAISSASPNWGIAVLCVAPAFGVISAMPAILLPRRSQALVAVAVVVPLVVVAGVQTLVSFRDSAPWKETVQITQGPFTGIRATPVRAAAVEDERVAVERWTKPSDSVFMYDSPGAYVFVRGRMDTNIIWMPSGGPINKVTLDFFTSRHDFPDVVFVFLRARASAIGAPNERTTDPLLRYFYSHYDEANTGTSSYLVFRKPPQA